jgi:hypothetical protein
VAHDFPVSIGVLLLKGCFVPIYNPGFRPRYPRSSLLGACNKFTSSEYTALRNVSIYSSIISLQGDRFSYVSANLCVCLYIYNVSQVPITSLDLRNILGLKTLKVLEDA